MAITKALHNQRFPGETPEYRRARNRLLRSEIELRRETEKVAAQRRKLPAGGTVRTDYEFEGALPGDKETRTIRLSELFAPRMNSLFIYNFMFPENLDPKMTPCPSCTSIIDAIDGAAPHVVQRINFAVVAKAPIERFRAHARKRGWRNVVLLSSANNSFNRDYNAETPDGFQLPIAHTFARRGKKIHHVWSSELFYAPTDPGEDMRHVDFMWPMWSMFDATPGGRGSFYPRLSY